MEYAQLLLVVLTEFGGNGTDAANDIPRHVLPMVIWGVIFFTGCSISRRRSTTRDRFLLIAIAFNFIFEAVCFGVSFSTHTVHYPSSTVDAAYWVEQIFEPLIAAMLIQAHLLLAAAMLRFIPSYNAPRIPKRFLFIGSSVIWAVSAMVIVYQWFEPNSQGDGAFRHSLGYGVLLLVNIIVLIYAVKRLLSVRSDSHISRIAWVPFACYCVAQILLLVNVINFGTYQTVLVPIANNLHIWAIPWFGYAYWRDLIEEQQQLVVRLHQTERLDVIGRLAAGVAHDFNNNLQAILGFAEVGRDSAAAESENTQYYDSVIESVERARVLVKQLIVFQRDAASNDLEAVNVAQVVAELAPMLNGLIGPSTHVVNDIDPDDWFLADRSLVEQVIVNLTINARDAMPNGGSIALKSKRINFTPQRSGASQDELKPMIRISITDTGKGMTEYEMAHVFEPFFTTKEKQGGSGLGMASSLGAVRSMGGDMRIESAVGRGTTVIIDMVAAQESDFSAVAAPVSEASIDTFSGNERILLAEDEPALRNIMGTQLIRAGYDATLARDGAHALELLESAEQPFDLLVLDFMMPRLDGSGVYDYVLEHHPSLPVIFVTAHSNALRERISNVPFLNKPVKQRALIEQVRTTIDRAKA